MGKRTQSIMVGTMECCLLCGNPNFEVHHCIYGRGQRRLSDKYGLIVPLCYEHHRGDSGAHFNKELDLQLKALAQKSFEAKYSHEEYMEIFGRNYL